MTALKCFGLVLLLIGLAEGYFEDCNYQYVLNPNSVSSLQLNYPAGASCRYELIAPQDYEILAQCSISLYSTSNSCPSEYFYIDREGDLNLASAEYFCGTQTITRVSLFRRLVIAFTSQSYGGSIDCTLTTRPQACDCGWTVNTRIVGGQEASIGEFPAMVGLRSTITGQNVCGGTILSHRVVLTAEHCTKQYNVPSEIQVVAGDHDVTSTTESKYQAVYAVSYYVEHPGYNPTTNENDIALLITSTNIEWSRGVGPACLPFGQTSNTFDYTTVQIVGWGTTSFAGPTSPTLQKADVSVLPNSVCQGQYPSLVASQMCTYYPGKDSCQLDSGGPCIYKGVREFILCLISSGNGCGTEPGINTRVTSFLDWISSNALGVLCQKPFN